MAWIARLAALLAVSLLSTRLDARPAPPAPAATAEACPSGLEVSPERQAMCLAGVAAAARPERAALWRQAAELTFDWPDLRLAFWARAAAAPDADPAAVAEGRIRELLRAGLAGEALALFDGLPPAVRQRLLATAGKAAAPDVYYPPDLRIELAVARGLAGDRTGARALLARLPAPAAGDPPESFVLRSVPNAGRGRLIVRRLVEDELAERSPADPFPTLVATVASQEEVLPYATDRLAVARLAEREGYPAFAVFVLAPEPIWPEPPRLAPAVASAVARAAARYRGLLAAERAEAAVLRARANGELRAGLGADPRSDLVAASVARNLAAPAGRAFVERLLPAGLPPASPGDARLAGSLRLHDGCQVVRVERASEPGDRRAAAILRSSGRAEAYSIALSADGGATWSRPYGTGLFDAEPYIVRPASSLPLLAGDRLEIEVEKVPANGGIVMPSGHHVGPGEAGFFLEIPLADLTRDRDGDGATDLEEESVLLTDPDLPDTDGDGLPDGADPLPLVPAQAGRATAAFAALLADGAVSSALGAGVGAPARAALLPGDAALVVADRPLLAGLTASRTIVVLTPEEEEAGWRRLAPLVSLRVPLFAFDRSGRRAVAVWSASWESGTILLEEKADGTWRSTELGFWVS